MKKLSVGLCASLMICLNLNFTSCSDYTETPDSEESITDFHKRLNDNSNSDMLDEGLCLYVDYSTCVAMGQSSPFFNKIMEPLTEEDHVTEYYAIRGSRIDSLPTDDVYGQLTNIEEVDFADLVTAADRIANGTQEAVLVTDGEYYTQSTAKANDNNAYLAKAFCIWLLKGHDIYIVSEQYIEPYKGKEYNKKRFYFYFTDSRKPGNIFEKVKETLGNQLNDTAYYHLGLNNLEFNPAKSYVADTDHKFGIDEGYNYEIEDWSTYTWDNIKSEVVDAQETAISLNIEAKSFGGFRITSIGVRTFDITRAYADYCDGTESDPAELDNFFVAEMDKRSNVELKFDNFNLNSLNGSPCNWLMVQLYIDSAKYEFDEKAYSKMFEFESISKHGETNNSVAASIRQCLTDHRIKEMISDKVFYTIYIKTSKK